MLADDQPGVPVQRSGIDPKSTGQDALGVVAVVSDGSALGSADRNITAEFLAVLLEDDAAGLHARAGVPVRVTPLAVRADADLAAALSGLPADTGAIFLTHTDPERARVAQQTVQENGGPAVLTDADTTAIALTAALLTTVVRGGHKIATSRVIVAGATALPELCSLLTAIGVGDISSWNARDARAFPLHHLARHATAVIDLLGVTRPSKGWVPADYQSNVISLDDPGYRLLPAPGLFAALARCPDARLDVDVSRACALALLAETPQAQLVPQMDDPGLTEAIVAAVLRVLDQRA